MVAMRTTSMFNFHTAILIWLGASFVICDDVESYCPKFEYDRHLLEKIIRVESENEVCAERLTEMEERLKILQEDFFSLADRVKTKIDDTVTEATRNFVRIPDVDSDETDGWKMVFRATAGNGQNVYAAWTEGVKVTTVKPTDMKRSNSKHYKNLNLMNEWMTRPVREVKFSMFDNQQEVVYIVFNGTGTSRNTWFTESRVIFSSYPSLLEPASYNYFSASGHPEVKRRFFINMNYGGCPLDKGYLTVVDTGVATQHICDWDKQATFPQFLYSTAPGPIVWDHLNYGLADYIAIFIK